MGTGFLSGGGGAEEYFQKLTGNGRKALQIR